MRFINYSSSSNTIPVHWLTLILTFTFIARPCNRLQFITMRTLLLYLAMQKKLSPTRVYIEIIKIQRHHVLSFALGEAIFVHGLTFARCHGNTRGNEIKRRSPVTPARVRVYVPMTIIVYFGRPQRVSFLRSVESNPSLE
jgi:hypothetical protein